MPKSSFIVLIIGLILLFPATAKAQSAGLSGGKSNHIYIKTGSGLKIASEAIEVKLHIGYAEVRETYQITNPLSDQKVVIAVNQDASRENSENLISNFHVIAANQELIVTNASDVQNGIKILVRSFELEFASEESKTIEINYWQINSASLRGERGFTHSFKANNFGKIDALSGEIELMDGLSLKDFKKDSNPDLDLKIEPLGSKEENQKIIWNWQNLEPTFDLIANFYWSKGDLAKMALLDKNLSLYKVKASFDDEASWQLADSSYLTAWPEKDGPVVGSELEFSFETLRKIQQINIITGKANNLADFKANNRPQEITISDGSISEKYVLEDRLMVQNINLKNTLETDRIKITIDSVYPGSVQNNKTYISEIEFINEAAEKVAADQPKSESHPFKSFFTNLWQAISNFFKSLF